MATNPWINTTWEMSLIDGAVSALFKSGRASGRNRFWLANVTVGTAECYAVQFRDDAMTKYWRNLVFVSRGNRMPTLPPLAKQVLAGGHTPANLQKAGRIFTEAPASDRISTHRLECDVSIPIPRSSRLELGRLRLFVFPKALRTNKALLVIHFRSDSRPNGVGGGGSVHN